MLVLLADRCNMHAIFYVHTCFSCDKRLTTGEKKHKFSICPAYFSLKIVLLKGRPPSFETIILTAAIESTLIDRKQTRTDMLRHTRMTK